MRRSGLFLVTVALALALAIAAQAQAVPTLGVNIAGLTDPSLVTDVQAVGAKSVRAFIDWDVAEPVQGQLNSAYMDAHIAGIKRAQAAGLKVDLPVVRTPRWASGSTNPAAPPRDPNDYASFLSRFAGDPRIAGTGIAYEIWNEEDGEAFWAGAPNASAYAALVKAAYPAIKAADPTAQVILGGLTGNNYEFIGDLYKFGIKGNFDAAAVHTDTACLVAGPSEFYRENGRLGRFSFLGYREVRATMIANGDDKPIWMTEFGWSSTQKSGGGGPACQRGLSTNKKPSGVTEDEQAKFLQQAVRCMSADPYLQSASWFTMRDDSSQKEDELRHYGLLRSGVRKPAWTALNELITGAAPVFGGCGDFGGPTVVIQSPQVGQSFRGALKIRVVATDPTGITGIRYFADRTKFTSVNNGVSSGKPVTITWQGAKKLSPGLHTIKVVAVDKKGNETPASVEVRKVGGKFVVTGPPVFKVGGVKCKGANCAIQGSLADPSGKALKGKLQVKWQKLKGKKWRTIKQASRGSKKRYRFAAKKLGKGSFRVGVVFRGRKPIKGGRSEWTYFVLPVPK